MMPEWVIKYIVLFLITLGFKWIFSIFYHFGAVQVYEGHSEENANQVCLLLKYLSFILVAVLFSLILLWKYIGFIDLVWYHKLFVFCFFFYLLAYCRSSISLLNHMVNVFYIPHFIKEIEYETVFGEIKKEQNLILFEHEGSRTNLDLTKRV